MKPYIVTNKEFLHFFNQLPPKTKRDFIPTLKKNHVNTISEVCKNFLNRKLTRDSKVI